MAGVGGGRRWRASRRSRRRSRTKTPVSLIKPTKTRHRSKQRKQRTAHPELARVINHKCLYTPHRLQVAREPGRRRRRQRNMTNEGIIDGGDMPTGTRTGPQIGSLTQKKRRRQRFFSIAGENRDHEPTRRRGAAPDHQDGGGSTTRPHSTDRPTDTHRDDRERPYLADRWLGGPLLAGGAAEVWACAGCDGFRDGSRPSRPQHGHARCSRRGRTRLRGRQRPPAQLQGVAQTFNLSVVGGFASILRGVFMLPEAHATSTGGASVRLRLL